MKKIEDKRHQIPATLFHYNGRTRRHEAWDPLLYLPGPEIPTRGSDKQSKVKGAFEKEKKIN